MSNPVGSGNNELDLSEEKMDQLLNPNRIDLIKAHRSNVGKFDPKVAEAVGYLRVRKSLFNGEPKNCLKVKSEGLDKIGLKEMEEGVVYEGKILKVMSVDRARSYEFEYPEETSPVKVPLSIQVLVQDDQGDFSRAFIYNFLWPSDKVWNKSEDYNDEEVQRNVGIGRKMTIVHPILKMAKDGKLTIVVDDPAHLILDENVTDEGNNLCRFCLNPDAKKRCAKCKTAYYCARVCQANDWTHNKHKLICFGITKANEHSPYALEYAERPLWTVYELERYCFHDPPGSLFKQMRKDYGFDNCRTFMEDSNLYGLYQGMIKVMRVDLVKLHVACMSGTLEDFITSCFAQYPSTLKGAYYEWFVKHRDVVRNRFTNN